jgi:hypothetical protein
MKIWQYQPNEDGSATMEVTMDTEEVAKLLELGFVTALKNYIEDTEDGNSDG